MDVILDRGSTPLTSTKGLAHCASPFVFLQEPSEGSAQALD